MAKRKRGRPPFSPTAQNRRTVEEMKACGEPTELIARALRLDVDTLKRHFADELAQGHAERRREVVGLLFKTARKGNVTAIKKLEEMTRIAGADADALGQPEAPARPAKLGKKAQAQAEAEAVVAGGGADWGDDLQPGSKLPN